MRILLLFIFTFYYHVVIITTLKIKSIKFDINEDLTFDEFKKLIEKKGLEKDYPDINK